MALSSKLLFMLILCQLSFSFTGGSPVSGGGSGRYSLGGFVLFIGVMLVSLIFVVIVCLEGGCWPFRYFRRRDGVAVAGIDNPLANSSGMELGVGITEMDVRALELDPIVFEPLPTVSDLTPRRSGDGSHINGKHFGAIVPFSSPESHIYAHDWFDEPFRNFPRGNIQYIRELGKGWFGQVIEGEAKDIVPYAKNMRVIVKALRGDASDAEQMRFLDESRLYRDGNHGNILKLLGHSIETNPFLLLMEYCALGDLKSYLIANVTRAEVLNSRGDILKMALDIAKGLEWMAASDFTHGDLAARNCQVGSEGRILIGDYGLSTQTYKDDYYWGCGNVAIPLRWVAPESIHCTINTIQTLKVTKEANVWTFGILLWEVAEFGKLPYFELNDEEVITRVIVEKNYVLGSPTMPSILLRDDLYSLMTACWSPNPSQRPSISSIVDRLQFLIQTLASLPTRDEFEAKWETAPATQLKKKSVSFSGEAEKADLPQVNFAISTPVTPMTESVPFAKTQIQFEKREDPFPSLDLWKPSDPEEEDYKQRIERGEITQKVREKSESVQDLMILTHVEPSDLSDGESLVIVDSLPPQGTLRRASSETAINSPSKGSSQNNTKPSGSFLHPTNNTSNLFGSSPVNKTGIDINVINATPNPDVSINIIQATPTPIKREIPEPSPPQEIEIKPINKDFVKRRFVFRDDEDNHENGKSVKGNNRHHSTPIRSPFPLPETGSDDSEVFKGGKEQSCQISPISQTALNNSIHSRSSSNAYSISVYGPAEEYGLEPFGKVSSTVDLSPISEGKHPSMIPKKLNFENEVNSPAGSSSWVQISSLQSQTQPESWLVYSKDEANSGEETRFIPKKDKIPSKVSLDSFTVIPSDTSDLTTKPDQNSTPQSLTENNGPTSLEGKLKTRFQEEIAGVNDEVGGVIFHDLERDGEYKLIKEDRETGEESPLTSLTTRSAFGGEVGGGDESQSLSPIEDTEPIPFVPSKWDSKRNPAKSAIKTPETTEEVKVKEVNSGIRKSVSFERKKRQMVYSYPPPTPQPDSEEEDHINPSGPLALSLDWELDADEMMEGVVEDEWEVDGAGGDTKTSNNPMDMYRISPFSANDESPEQTTPGLLNHTRPSLKLDIKKKGTGEGTEKMDSGVGSSTNVSPFSHCDN